MCIRSLYPCFLHTDKYLYNLTLIMYVWTLSMFISIHRVIRAVGWVQILFGPFLSELPFRSRLPPNSNAEGWSQSRPQLPAPQNGASSPSDFQQPALPSSLSPPRHVLWTPWYSFLLKPWQSGDVRSGHVWPDCTFMGFFIIFFFLQVVNTSLFRSSGDRHVTVGLTGNQVNFSSAHVQPVSPPSSWDPTLTANLALLQKFL